MKNRRATWKLPEMLNPEFRFLEKRLDKSIEWVNKHRDEIHPSISFIQAIEIYDMGIDVTQIKPK